MNQQSNKKLIVVLIIAIVLVFLTGILIWRLLQITENGFIERIQQIDLLADWKTYKNEKYGFEIKYSPDWTYSSPGLIGEVEFCGPWGFADSDNPEFGCEIREQTNVMSDAPRSMASLFLFVSDVDYKRVQNCSNEITESGIKFFDCNDGLYWQKGNYFYQFRSNDGNDKILNEMFSTFRFLN